jgi:hypothetical protein
MTDRWLQRSYLVTGLQPLLTYNDVMRLAANEQRENPLMVTPRAADLPRAHARSCRVVLLAAALVGLGVLATACGGAPTPGVASLGNTSTTGPSTAQSGSSASVENALLAYTHCMRTHGVPNMPEPTIDASGMHLSATIGSGFDPNTPQFAAANKQCMHLVPRRGGVPPASTITPADQADYLKATACMRSHGIPNFPDPVFSNNTVTFSTSTSIDTNSAQYKNAFATCQKLIPAGLPYSSASGS